MQNNMKFLNWWCSILYNLIDVITLLTTELVNKNSEQGSVSTEFKMICACLQYCGSTLNQLEQLQEISILLGMVFKYEFLANFILFLLLQRSYRDRDHKIWGLGPIFRVSHSGWQAFTNCMHGYECAHKVHPNDVTHTQRFVHDIDSSV